MNFVKAVGKFFILVERKKNDYDITTSINMVLLPFELL